MKFEWINTAYSRDKKNQSVERLAAEREVEGLIPGAGQAAGPRCSEGG